MAEAELTIDPAEEAAPPPFDDFLRGQVPAQASWMPCMAA